MASIKHSKYRNSGILFELLVRQTTADLVANKDSKAVKYLKSIFLIPNWVESMLYIIT